MSLSINSNSDAFAAQNALRSASTQLSTVSAQLASGNEITNPSINASGLAIGTTLQTAASTLTTALAGANNATSLLQIAAGGLSSVGTILQRLQSLATQANSGGTSTTDGFLNQEYQALTAQIDQIAQGTSFNSTQLLNGSLAGSVSLNTNTNIQSAAPTNTAQTVFTFGSTVLPTEGSTITIGGTTVTFTTNASNVNEVLVGANQTTTASNLASFLNSDAGASSTIGSFHFTAAGTATSAYFIGGKVGASTSALTLTSSSGTYTVGTSATATMVTGNGGSGLAAGRVSAYGTLNDSFFKPLSQGGLDTSAIINNSAFIGTISGFTATYTAANTVTLSVQVGNVTYTAAGVNTAAAAGAAITFSGVDNTGTAQGSFIVTQAGNTAAVTDQADANNLATRFNTAFSGVTVQQNRDVSSYVGGGTILTNGQVTGSLLATSLSINGSSLSNQSIGGVTVTAPGAGQTSGVISFTVNGQTYTSSSTIGSTIAAASYVTFQNQANPAQYIGFQNGATAIQFGTAAQASSLQTALQNSLGLGNGAGNGLVYQVGTQSNQTINVTLASSTSSALGLAGTDISNSADATTAATAVSAAINTNSAQQASIGAQESRFNYVIANLTTSIQNTQAAAGTYLDTDISTASTTYASDQVKEEAGISVLAQLNQLPQNLLKLLS